jgi:integrase
MRQFVIHGVSARIAGYQAFLLPGVLPMPRIRLTEAAVRRLKLPAKGQTDYFDELLPGFGLRVSASGRRSWFLFYRVKEGPKQGTQRRYTLPASAAAMGLADAREAAREVMRRVELGGDPSIEKRRQRAERAAALTVRQAAETFVERHAKARNRSWRETARILETNVSAEWGDMALEDITRADVVALIDRIAERAPVMANRTLATLRKMLRWHVERGTLESSPAEGVSAPARERSRDRILTEDEIRWFWKATGEDGYPFGMLCRLLLVTAQRRDEVGLAAWSEIDLERRLWTMPREKTKGDRAHEVPLSPLALDLIADLPRNGPLLFSTSVAGDRPVSGYSHAKARISQRMEEIAGVPIPPWRLHDLRRTAGTGMAAAGVPVSTISRVLNHAEGGVTKIYNRFSYAEEKRQALEAWGRRLKVILNDQHGKVVDLAVIRG